MLADELTRAIRQAGTRQELPTDFKDIIATSLASFFARHLLYNTADTTKYFHISLSLCYQHCFHARHNYSYINTGIKLFQPPFL